MKTETRKHVEDILRRARFDVWNLAGTRNKEARRNLITLLTGEQRPLAKCGVNALEAEIENAFPHIRDASCAARRRHELAKHFPEKS